MVSGGYLGLLWLVGVGYFGLLGLFQRLPWKHSLRFARCAVGTSLLETPGTGGEGKVICLRTVRIILSAGGLGHLYEDWGYLYEDWGYLYEEWVIYMRTGSFI
jgi:hypothetical protein